MRFKQLQSQGFAELLSLLMSWQDPVVSCPPGPVTVYKHDCSVTLITHTRHCLQIANLPNTCAMTASHDTYASDILRAFPCSTSIAWSVSLREYLLIKA